MKYYFTCTGMEGWTGVASARYWRAGRHRPPTRLSWRRHAWGSARQRGAWQARPRPGRTQRGLDSKPGHNTRSRSPPAPPLPSKGCLPSCALPVSSPPPHVKADADADDTPHPPRRSRTGPVKPSTAARTCTARRAGEGWGLVRGAGAQGERGEGGSAKASKPRGVVSGVGRHGWAEGSIADWPGGEERWARGCLIDCSRGGGWASRALAFP